MGRCTQFDPHAESATLALDPDITKALEAGTVLDHLGDEEVRLQWTVSCKQCGQTYRRSNDLGAHIMQCHADLWQQAQPLIRMLVEAWFSEHGCLCNPIVPYPRASHVCPIITQLAMHHVRSKADILVPYLLTDDEVTQRLETTWDMEVIQMIKDSLQQRNFQRLWQDPLLTDALAQAASSAKGSSTVCPAQSLVDHPQREGVDTGGRKLAIHEMGQGGLHLDSEQGQKADRDGGHAETHRRDSGAPPGPDNGPEISGNGPLKGADSAMEASTESALQHSHGVADEVVRKLSDAFDRDHPESAPAAIVQTGQGSAANDGEGERQRQDGIQSTDTDSLILPTTHCYHVQNHLLSLILTNPRNLCAANAATTAWLWATVSTEQTLQSMWGSKAAAVMEWLGHLDPTSPVCLTAAPWFQDLLTKWGSFERQADGSEFVQMLIGDAPAFELSWQRRVEKGPNVSTEVAQTFFHPLILQVPADLTAARINVMQLLEQWTQVDGMSTALTHAPALLCLQIDRSVQDHNNQVVKSLIRVQAYPILEVPVFTSNGMQTISQEYVLLAMITHLGHHEAGHYRAATRFWDDRWGWQWAIHEDDIAPNNQPHVPTWIEENVVILLYCQKHLHRYETTVTEANLFHPTQTALDRRILSLLK
eukprot:Skav216089  [mRNA]  locus=scaffold2042:120191:122846:+ [translate_table: standard]